MNGDNIMQRRPTKRCSPKENPGSVSDLVNVYNNVTYIQTEYSNIQRLGWVSFQ